MANRHASPVIVQRPLSAPLRRASPPELSEVMSKLEAITAKVDVLDAKIETLLTVIREDSHRRQARPMRVGLVPAIAAAVHDTAFTVAELYRHAEIDHGLAAAIEAAQFPNAQAFGKFLQRLEGQAIDGWRLERIGVEDHAAVWRVFAAE
jgi:hypothetical protein